MTAYLNIFHIFLFWKMWNVKEKQILLFIKYNILLIYKQKSLKNTQNRT